MNPEIAGLVISGSKEDDASEGGEPEVGEEGCACTTAPGGGSPLAALLLLLVPALRRRRR